MPATCEPCAAMSRSEQPPALINAALHSLPSLKFCPPTFPGGVPMVVRSQRYRIRVDPSACLKSACDQSMPVSKMPTITPLPVAPVNVPPLAVRTRLARMSCMARSLLNRARRAACTYRTRASASNARRADNGTRAPNNAPACTVTRPPNASITAGDRSLSDTNTSTNVSGRPGSRRSITTPANGRRSAAPNAAPRGVASMRATAAGSSSGRSRGSSLLAGACARAPDGNAAAASTLSATADESTGDCGTGLVTWRNPAGAGKWGARLAGAGQRLRYPLLQRPQMLRQPPLLTQPLRPRRRDPRGHYPCALDVPDHAGRVLAAYDGKQLGLVFEQLDQGVLEQFVGVRGGRRPLCDPQHRGLHHVPDLEEMQRIHDVFAGQVIPAARDLLGEDGALHEEHGHGVGGDAGDQQPGQHVDVVRELQDERHGRERRAHRATHRRPHADRGPEAGIARRNPGGREGAERAPHDEEGGEHAPGGTRAQGRGPDHGLRQHEPDQRDADEPSGEQIVDRVVSDAQRAGVEQSAQSHYRPAQHGPPHPMDRQLAEQVLRGRSAAEQRHPQRARHRRRAGDRNKAAGLPFKEQQLHREQGRGHRCAEHRRHPAGRDGNADGPQPERICTRRCEARVETMEVGEVREEADEAHQREGDERADHAHQRRHGGESDDADVGGEVAERVFERWSSSHAGRRKKNVIGSCVADSSALEPLPPHLETVAPGTPRARYLLIWFALFTADTHHANLRRRPMPISLRPLPGAALGAAATVLFTLLPAGCDQGSTGPQLGNPAQFSRVISLPDLRTHLTTGPARVEVRVIPGGLTARSVEIKGPDEVTRRDEIRSRVTAISATGSQGTVTLALGNLQVGFNSSTMFRPDDGNDPDAGTTALANFVARVQAELAAGSHPAVQVRRSAPAQPQAPGDASLTADELRLDDEADHPAIKLNITAANLSDNTTPPPDGWLTVLGLKIELRVTEGTTTLRAEMPDIEGEHEFEGVVQSVDATAGTVTLKSGTIIRIVAGTEIEAKEREEDADQHLASLADVQAALTAGKTVKSEGEGSLTAPTR